MGTIKLTSVICEKIKNQRKELELTYSELSELTNLPLSTIHSIFYKRIKEVPISHITEIYKALSLPTNELVLSSTQYERFRTRIPKQIFNNLVYESEVTGLDINELITSKLEDYQKVMNMKSYENEINECIERNVKIVVSSILKDFENVLNDIDEYKKFKTINEFKNNYD